jgi:hypothetical protein
MKKTALALILTLSLLASLMAGTTLVNMAYANPLPKGNKPPPAGTQPPIISIFSPNNNTVFAGKNVSLAFNATGTYILTDVWFEVDWQEGNTSVYHLDVPTPDYLDPSSGVTNFSYNKNLTGIPEGTHTIQVIASAHGYYLEGLTTYSFDINGSSLVYFSIGEPFPTTLVIATSVIAAVVCIGSIAYFKRHKSEAKTS